MNQFLKTLGNFLPFFEGQEKSFLNTQGAKVLGDENARLGKKLNRTVCTQEEIAICVKVLAELTCAEEEAVTK